MASWLIPSQLFRSKTAATRPPSLLDGQLFINQADGVLCWPNAAGVVQTTNLIAPPFFRGTAIVDFGAGGATDTLLAITGQTGIVATSAVVATVLAMPSADHSADEHWAETLFITAGNIIPGTGFTIYAKCGNSPCFGKFNIAWRWA